MEIKKIKSGSRIGAMLLDHIIMSIIITLLVMPVMSFDISKSLSNDSLNSLGGYNWTILLMMLGLSLYFNKDLIQGKSLAKRALGQEVINNRTNEVASPIKCFIRNLTIILWPIEVIVVLFNPSRRIGDYIAGTRVEYITNERNSKPKVDLKQVSISLVLGFVLLLSASFFYPIKNESPNYVVSTYNRELSLELEKRILENHPNYIVESNIKVFDEMENDSLKYVYGAFSLTDDYIENDLKFNEIKSEIFETMFEIIPKGEFILLGKFIYNSKSLKKSTEKEYDWR